MKPKDLIHEEAAELLSVIEAAVDGFSQQLPQTLRRHIGGGVRHIHSELMQGRGADAIAESRAIAELTDLPAAHLLLAWVLLETNQPLSALAALFDLEQFQAEMAEADLIKGLILCTLDRRAEARSALQRAVQRKPELVPAWKLLIKMAVEEENHNAAFLVFLEALRHSLRHPKLLALQSCLRPTTSSSTTALLHGLASKPARVKPRLDSDYTALVSATA